MTSLRFATYVACLCMWGIACQKLPRHQEIGFVSRDVGGNVTLRCFHQGVVAAVFLWYKQTLGQNPRLISTFYKHTEGTFSDEYKNNVRFSLQTKDGENHLMITDLHVSDSAYYYCVRCYAYKFEFLEGVAVSVKGSGLVVPVKLSASGTLNCIIDTWTCDGEHSVYWIKDSGEPHPGLIYTNGGKNDQCERDPDIQTHSCVYELPMASVNRSHAGMDYCTVASCGHILFGNQLKLDHGDDLDSSDPLVYLLSGSLTITTALVVFMSRSVYTMYRRSCQCSKSHARFETPFTTNAEDADNLHYAALSVNQPNRSRRKRDGTYSECVYSSVKQ